MRRQFRGSFLLLFSLSTLLACGEEVVVPEAVKLTNFAVAPTDTTTGQRVAITWAVENAVSINITANGAALVSNETQQTGSVDSPPLDQDTTFQLVATGESGDTVMASESVTVVAIRIDEFSANPAMISLGEMSTLTWGISGEPTMVTITDSEGAELFSGDNASGTLEVAPQTEETYTLTALNAGGQVTQDVTVQVMVEQPEITSFTVFSDSVPVGERAQLFWETQGALEVQVLQDGAVRRPWNAQGADSGSVQLVVNSAVTVFTLQARNPFGEVEEMITVMGQAVPVINLFDVTPMSYTAGSTVATVNYDVSDADSLTLQVNGNDVSNFPAMNFSGSFDLTITGGDAEVTLIARNSATEIMQSAMIVAGYNDREPNNTFDAAVPIPGDRLDVRGTLDPNDVDMYAVMVPQGSRIFAQVGFDAVTGCSFDTILDLIDLDGNSVLGTVDDTEFPPIQPCAEINPMLHRYADSLPAGVYYIAVRGAAAVMGRYNLIVEVTGPPVDFPGVMQNELGMPIWQLEDFNMFSLTVGRSDTMYAQAGANIQSVFNPYHQLVDFQGISAVMAPQDPAYFTLYSGEIGAGIAARGFESKSTFSANELTDPNGLMVAYAMTPRAGLSLPDMLFPMTVQVTLSQGGNNWFGPTPYTLPSLNDIFMGMGPAVTGHRMLGSLAVQGFGGGAAVTGSFSWTFSFLDATGNGWNVQIPFTVQ